MSNEPSRYTLTNAQAVIAKAMREAELEENIRQMCKALGLRRYHTNRSDRSPTGFPDDVIVGTGVIFRELKRYSKDPTHEQREWLDALTEAGQDADVWRPQDWMSGRIEDELRALC